MAARPMLVVMIVRDAGLRSALAARLSTDFDLLTPQGWSDTLVERGLVRAPAVLVIDEESAAGEQGGWIKARAKEGLFSRVVVITVDAPGPAEEDWLIQINRSEVIHKLSQLFNG